MLRLLLATTLLAGCTHTRECKTGSLLVDLTLEGGAEQADTLLVTVSYGTTSLQASGKHTAGVSHGTLELDFVTYPAAQSVTVTIYAQLGSATLATGGDTFTLDPRCTRHAVTVAGTSSSSDLAGVTVDLTGVTLDLSGADLALADLATPPQPDLAGPPDTTASCPLNGLAAICTPFAGSTTPVASTQCKQSFPPASGVQCDVPNGTGTTYFVDAATGDDNNTGLSQLTAWQTLCKATSAPAHSTIRVANGTYDSAQVLVQSALTIQGGWDSSFTLWDPDSNPTYFTGTLILDNDGAVWGGFRMVQRPSMGKSSFIHQILSGTFMRNYVDIVYSTTANEAGFTGLNLGACAGHTTHFQCNDVYVKASKNSPDGTTFSSAQAIGSSVGDGSALDVSQDRICFEGAVTSSYASLRALGANGHNTTGRITLTNDFIEFTPAGSNNVALEVYNAGGNLSVILTNSTITGPIAISSYGGVLGSGLVQWSMANNILFCPGGPCSKALNFNPGTGNGPLQISSSLTNLIFGYTNNMLLPAPIMSSGDDTTGTATTTTTFLSPTNYHPSPAGPAAGTGTNVYNDPAWGSVTVDLDNMARPGVGKGAWDRGAYSQ